MGRCHAHTLTKMTLSRILGITEAQYRKLEEIANKHFKNIKGKIDGVQENILKEIILAKPNELEGISETYKGLAEQFKNKYKNFTNKKKEYDAYELAESLNINTCPYCNINSTYTVIKNKDEKITRPEFDHFYDKATYPILSLSFYNLIPSCHTCNSSLKSSKKFSIKTHLHPYSDNFNDKVKFHLHINDSRFFYNEKGFKIALKTEDVRAKNNIDSFKLETLYQNHKDIVLELIQKREIYPDSYIDELAHNYSGLFKNREDLLRLITSGYVEDKDLNKRPLSKLIKDISEELELI
ncbi:MAG: hypothetical protein Q9M28_10905 [Mariprofundaceae bacterium]|nr:hypothetical protein [Mariprofundaceae bacterium]